MVRDRKPQDGAGGGARPREYAMLRDLGQGQAELFVQTFKGEQVTVALDQGAVLLLNKQSAEMVHRLLWERVCPDPVPPDETIIKRYREGWSGNEGEEPDDE